MTDSSQEHPPVSPRHRHLAVLVVIGLVTSGTGWWYSQQWQGATSATARVSGPPPRPKLNAPFIRTQDQVVEAMIELARITPQDLVYDLGCGDGKLVIGACVQRSCRGIGYDIEPQRIQEAEENARLHKVEHLVKFERADVFELDLRPASVVLLYLLPRMVQDLVPQFEQCSPGTRIVSEDWAIDGVQADEQREVLLESGERHTLFLYTLPLRRKA